MRRWLNFTWTTSDWRPQRLHLVSNIINRRLPQKQHLLLKRPNNKMKRFKNKLLLFQTKNSREWSSTRIWCTKIISSSSNYSLLSNSNSKWWTLNSNLSLMVLRVLSLLLQERSQDLVSTLRLCKCRCQHILMVNLEQVLQFSSLLPRHSTSGTNLCPCISSNSKHRSPSSHNLLHLCLLSSHSLSFQTKIATNLNQVLRVHHTSLDPTHLQTMIHIRARRTKAWSILANMKFKLLTNESSKSPDELLAPKAPTWRGSLRNALQASTLVSTNTRSSSWDFEAMALASRKDHKKKRAKTLWTCA